MRRPLLEKHAADLRGSGLTDETIERSGIFSATAKDVEELVGFSVPGMVLPQFAPDGSILHARVKPDEPLQTANGTAKYLSPKREKNPAGNRLYIPQTLPDGVLRDSKRPLLITEGEKKALSLVQAGHVAVGLAGVTCWVNREGDESVPIRDLDEITWKQRTVFIVFDSDTRSNAAVKREEGKLAAELRSRGAVVRIARLPEPTAEEDQKHGLGGKFGADDLIVVRGEKALQTCLDRAKIAVKKATAPHAKTASAADLADGFLRDARFISLQGLRLRYWREEFYGFTGTHYRPIPTADLEARVMAWLLESKEHRDQAAQTTVRNVLLALKGTCLVSASATPPCWVEGPEDDAEGLLCFENGLARLDDMASVQAKLRPNTPDFFSLNCLPYNFDPDADCRVWLRFLEQALPDPEMRQLICEIFGYLLSGSTEQEKAFVWEGPGANGKTVALTVLRELLGPENCSAVPLEAFNPVRTFPLAAMVGKTANLVEEISELDKVAEGVLKAIVTGAPITVERKHKSSFEMIPTARLVFTTNVLPRITDRSDGIWRRFMILPFRNQILDEAKQDRRLIDREFWRGSGELAGVLNWAVGGYASLRQRGRFIEPLPVLEANQAYRRDCNPVALFLDEVTNQRVGGQVASRDLYGRYVAWCEQNGYRRMAANRFGQAVRSVRPMCDLSKHPQTVRGHRTRVWSDLELLD